LPSLWIYSSTAAGFALTLIGAYICLRWYSFWKRNYRGALITHGPYGRVRHPFYSGFLAFALGLVLLYPVLETVMLAILSVAVILVFIPREEEFLLDHYGNDYREYMERVRWRIIPGIY
jgi:protein-S-isoprenylcysteine O-methyltransferase Ste14